MRGAINENVVLNSHDFQLRALRRKEPPTDHDADQTEYNGDQRVFSSVNISKVLNCLLV